MQELEMANLIADITQAVVIILATIFTAQWTYRTFAHKEKIDELKEFKKMVELLHWKMEVFCIQVRPASVPDDREMGERLELAQIHNKMVMLASLNLYTDPKFRRQIQEIVGKWVANDRVKMMQRRVGSEISEAEIRKTWREFSAEYEEVKALIDEAAGRLI